MVKKILGAKFHQQGGYRKAVGGYAKMRCNGYYKRKCNCVIKILIEEVDEDLNEYLDEAFIQQYSTNLHEQECEFYATNNDLKMIIANFNEKKSNEKIIELKRRKTSDRSNLNTNNHQQKSSKNFCQTQLDYNLLDSSQKVHRLELENCKLQTKLECANETIRKYEDKIENLESKLYLKSTSNDHFNSMI